MHNKMAVLIGLALLGLLGGLYGCEQRKGGSSLGTSYSDIPPQCFEQASYNKVGTASWYGRKFKGKETASGEPFDPNAMTAAHRSLPFGTKLKVTHGSRSVIVTINDRGPFIRGRVLDLSTGAARAIGLTGRGVGRVVAEVM